MLTSDLLNTEWSRSGYRLWAEFSEMPSVLLIIR